MEIIAHIVPLLSLIVAAFAVYYSVARNRRRDWQRSIDAIEARMQERMESLTDDAHAQRADVVERLDDLEAREHNQAMLLQEIALNLKNLMSHSQVPYQTVRQ